MADHLLDVRRDGALVGTLERRRGRISFTYADEWRTAPDPTPLSLSMPIAATTHWHGVVDAWLWGVLPDNDAVLARWGRQFAVSTSHPFGLLANVGADLPGAMQVLPQDEPRSREADTTIPMSTADVSAALAEVISDHTAWLGARVDGRWSLAGAQPKIALLRNADGTWARPTGRVATNRILKPAIDGFVDHDINEHLSLNAAATLGLRAVRSELMTFGRRRAIVVERYDRIASSHGWRRIHQEDVCQALGVHPSRKYENEGGPTAMSIVELLRATVPDPVRSRNDIDAFVDALVFNWLIAGPDANAKNFSLLLEGHQVRLAPLYDLASMLPYDSHIPKVKLAMQVGGYYRLSSIGRAAWMRFATEARLDGHALVERARFLAAGIPDAYADGAAVLRRAGVRSTMLRRLTDTVAARAKHCTAALAQ